MDDKVQIFDLEIISFSATVKFCSNFISLSGYKKISEWISYLVKLKTLYPDNTQEYVKCIAILKHASFCEATFANLLYENNSDKNYLSLTLDFPDINSLNKFVDGFEEKVNSPASIFT